jgi:hypothetical protein
VARLSDMKDESDLLLPKTDLDLAGVMKGGEWVQAKAEGVERNAREVAVCAPYSAILDQSQIGGDRVLWIEKRAAALRLLIQGTTLHCTRSPLQHRGE